MKYDIALAFQTLPVLAAIVSFGFCLFVFLRNPRHPANIGFGLGMLSFVLLEVGGSIILFSGEAQGIILGKRISLVGEALLPSTWIFFSITFARANYKDILVRWRPVLLALILGSIFFIFSIKSPSFVHLPEGEINHALIMLGPVGRYFYVFLLVGMIINLIHLENTLRSSAGMKRQQIKNIIIGVGALFSFQVYLASGALLFSTRNIGYIPVSSGVLLICCIMLLFSMARNRLLDIDIFISRYVIYNSMTVLLVGVYLLIVGLVAQGIKFAGGSFDAFWSIIFVFTAILGVVAGLFSTRIRRKTQRFITKHFYRHKYEFKDKWMETTEKIEAGTDILQVQQMIVEMISETMGAREVFLWLHEPFQCNYRLTASTIKAGSLLQIREDDPLITYIRMHRTPFYLKDYSEAEHGETQEIDSLIQATRVVLCTPLIVGGETPVGFIMQGEDVAGEPYGKDDFDLLSSIASQAAGRVKNSYLTQELLAMKEAETFHQVSSFFIHDLKNLVSTLSLLVQNAEEHMSDPLFQKDAAGTLRSTVTKMNAMISNLTILYKGLKIDPRPASLNDLIEETVSTLNGQGSKRIVKRLENLSNISADAEQLTKVCLNLLLNAIEASPPEGEIEIRTFTDSENGDVVLTVADQGSGISWEFIQKSLFRPFQTTKPNGLGIGLFQCKKIIEAHHGRIEVQSEEGKGSVFRVTLPAAREKNSHE